MCSVSHAGFVVTDPVCMFLFCIAFPLLLVVKVGDCCQLYSSVL